MATAQPSPQQTVDRNSVRPSLELVPKSAPKPEAPSASKDFVSPSNYLAAVARQFEDLRTGHENWKRGAAQGLAYAEMYRANGGSTSAEGAFAEVNSTLNSHLRSVTQALKSIGDYAWKATGIAVTEKPDIAEKEGAAASRDLNTIAKEGALRGFGNIDGDSIAVVSRAVYYVSRQARNELIYLGGSVHQGSNPELAHAQVGRLSTQMESIFARQLDTVMENVRILDFGRIIERDETDPRRRREREAAAAAARPVLGLDKVTQFPSRRLPASETGILSLPKSA
jgi:hypothetical protein